MKFPLAGIREARDLLKFDEPPYEWNSGRIYLMEVNGFVKVGKTYSIALRAKQHLQAAKAYGFSIGRIAYSEQLSNVTNVEAAFHKSLKDLLLPFHREVYKSTIDDIMDAFDCESVNAKLRDIEEEERRRSQRAELRKEDEQRRANRRAREKARRDRDNLILEAAKCILEKN